MQSIFNKNAPAGPPPVVDRQAQLNEASSLKVKGIALAVVGALLSKFSILPVDDGFGMVFMIFQKLAGLFMAFKGIQMAAKARKMKARTVDETLAIDFRRPVLYVRSFDDDAKTLDKVYKWTAWFSPGAGARQEKRYEEVVTELLAPIGPMIAIGRPGEEVPELGAARTYTSDADWKDWVLRRHRECSMVLLQAGSSQGLLWEVERVFQRDTFKPTLVCFPPERPKGPPPEEQYQGFKTMLRSVGMRMPDSLGKSYVVWCPTPDEAVLVEPGGKGIYMSPQRLAPGFRGVWPLLDKPFPGAAFKAETLRRRWFQNQIAAIVYVVAVIGGGAWAMYLVIG